MSEQRKPSRAAAVAKSAIVDGSILCGAGLLTYGTWLIYGPAGFLTAGVLLLALGLKGARA